MVTQQIDNYTVSEEAFNLVDLCERALETLEAVYARFQVPLPPRRYWTAGRPAEDCAQAVVSFMQVYLGRPGDQANSPKNCQEPRTVELEITITREYPIGTGGKAISADKIIDASKWAAVDTWVLIESVNEFDRWEDGRPGLGVIATVNANKPNGGVQTVRLNLTIAVP